jgi:two-component system NarL family response regulator
MPDEGAQQDRTRIVVVDDHPSYAQGLEMLLKSIADDIEVVGVATDHDAALEMIGSQLPDVVLMDIRMPGSDGLVTTAQVRDMFPVVKVVMLTASEEDEDIFEAMRLGASGYLPKNIEVEELVSAVRAINRGQVVISPTVAGKFLNLEHSEPTPLLDSERELLKLIAEGYENTEIAARLSFSESTVKRHLRNILEKLQLHNRVQAAVYAAKKGWI